MGDFASNISERTGNNYLGRFLSNGGRNTQYVVPCGQIVESFPGKVLIGNTLIGNSNEEGYHDEIFVKAAKLSGINMRNYRTSNFPIKCLEYKTIRDSPMLELGHNHMGVIGVYELPKK
jgi:hypothetical protein